MKTSMFLRFASMLSILLFAAASLAQSSQAPIDPLCVADDENFTRFFDAGALAIAAFGFLVLPTLLPVFSRVANSWKWADPAARWRRLLWVPSLLFLLLFLLPQLARVGVFLRPAGLIIFHYAGNVRLEYLDCDLHAFPRDYGLFFFGAWSPGPDLMIRYWWAQVLVFLSYALVCSGLYFLVAWLIALRRVEELAR